MHPTADPDALGFDPARLARIDTHFAAYVDDGRLAGWQIAVARRGEVVRASTYGMRDLEAGLPVAPDTLWRIYSMTKPITSVAAMILWEEGWFELNDEVGRYIPAFADVRVFGKGSAQKPYTVPATAPIRMWHLLTHTAGLTYGFLYTSIVDQLYRAAGYGWASWKGRTCRPPARAGRLFRSCSSPARHGATPSPRTCSAGSSRCCPAGRSTSSLRSGSSRRSA